MNDGLLHFSFRRTCPGSKKPPKDEGEALALLGRMLKCAACSVCGTTHALRKDGTIYRHLTPRPTRQPGNTHS